MMKLKLNFLWIVVLVALFSMGAQGFRLWNTTTHKAIAPLTCSAGGVPYWDATPAAGCIPAPGTPTGKYIKYGAGGLPLASTMAASGVGATNDCDLASQVVTKATLASETAPVVTCTALTLAGSQFANQGTTTTLYHGNAAGNGSFGPVVSNDMNITTTTCSGANSVTAISAGGVGTCATPTEAAMTDGQITMSGQYCITTGAAITTLSNTRAAAGNVGYVYTGVATQEFFDCPLPVYFRTTAGKGIKITSVDISYTVAGTNDLSAHTATMQERCFANNAANAMTDKPITGTLATAKQANPYLTTLTVTTPEFENTADCEWNLELAVTPNTTTYTLWSLVWKFTRQE